MTVIAEYTLSAADFALGRAAGPGVGMELERLLPDEDRTLSYFWVEGAPDDFGQSLDAELSAGDVRMIDEFDDRRFYRGSYDPNDEPFVDAVCRFDAAVLSGKGNHERWNFQIGFESSDALSSFQSHCVEVADVDLDLDRLYEAVESGQQARTELTPRQRETLITAYREGYFEIPRKITLVDLAEVLDVSDQAVSERLRRGESKLIRRQLLND